VTRTTSIDFNEVEFIGTPSAIAKIAQMATSGLIGDPPPPSKERRVWIARQLELSVGTETVTNAELATRINGAEQ